MKKFRLSAVSVIVLLIISILTQFSADAENPIPSRDPDVTDRGFIDRVPPQIRDKLLTPKEESPSTTASASSVYSWYCRHLKDGTTPPCPSEMSFIEDHNGYFLGNTDEKVIYLTFDAGYENGNISKILDILSEKQVPGSFFVLENLVRRNEDLVKRMVDERHLVCNHTASHKDMSVADKDSFAAELGALEAALRGIGVECAPFYRPPEGKFCKNNLDWAAELGYSTVFWSFAYADWDNAAQPDPDFAMDKILSSTHNGMVILLHPTSSTNAEIIGRLIDSWRAEGYSFATLQELSN